MKQYQISDSKKVLEILNRVKFFNSFTSQEKKTLAQFYQCVASYGKGDFVIKEGDHDEVFYILLLGEVSVTLGTPPPVRLRLSKQEIFLERYHSLPARPEQQM